MVNFAIVKIQNGRLYINGKDAGENGVCMGDGFLDTLKQPVAVKEYVTNESRLTHGKSVVVRNVKKASRSITLTFNVHGDSRQDYMDCRSWLYGELENGYVMIKTVIPYTYNNTSKTEETYYHLVYTGKSVSYGEAVDHTNGKVTVGFDEPDPTARTSERPTCIVIEETTEE